MHENFLVETLEKTLEQYDETINAILFAKKGIIHPLIITPARLIRELKMATVAKDNEFPFDTNYLTVFKYIMIYVK